MDTRDLHKLYLAELQEAWSFEEQISSTLGELARRADNADLRAFLADDVAEAANHRDALGRILADHGAPAQEHRDQAMARILSEARGWADQIDTPAVRDAALIASAQRIQHYEIAVYGTLAAWAKLLGLDKDLGVLLTMLGEERKADATLTEMAMSGVNQRAAA